MATKQRNDKEGHRRGAMGVDGEKDGHFGLKTDHEANDVLYGRSWHHSQTKGTQTMDCSYDEPAKDGGDLTRNAIADNATKVLLGKGDHTTIHQTGIGRSNKVGGNR